MEVSRYRPRIFAWASVLAGLLCLAVAVGLESSGWPRVVIWYAVGSGVAGLVHRLASQNWLFGKLREAKPLPLGALDVSDPDRDVLFLTAFFFATYVAVAAGSAVLFHDSAAATLAGLAGAPTGLSLGSLKDGSTLKRWEAANGRLFIEGRRGFGRKPKLYVEDPAAASLDAR
jgi:hypothetical protein